ncbi:MAG: hypothetical protein K0R53_266 [Burkholderiales bacterium]|jgi:hypothetical protein|nr:hypothetical protein [Burkholderiales bacterium]
MHYSEHDIDREMGRRALAFVAPLFEQAVTDTAVGQSGVLYAIVMNPTRRYGECDFEEAVLVERAFGKPRDAWDADYAEYARKKARVSWQTGLDSGGEGTATCWAREGHGSPLAGGLVVDGIVAAVSGADPAYDEVLAGAIALSLRAIIKLSDKAPAS